MKSLLNRKTVFPSICYMMPSVLCYSKEAGYYRIKTLCILILYSMEIFKYIILACYNKCGQKSTIAKVYPLSKLHNCTE